MPPLVVVAEAREPGGEPFDRNLEIGVQVDEFLHAISEPVEGHFFVASSALQFFDTAVREIHVRALRKCLLDHGLLLGHVTLVCANGRRR